jgi:trehalose/maltose transport system permease protein
MSTPKAMQQSFALRFSSGAFLAFWCLLASFPIFWIAVMSFKSPVDAFAASPWDVITGPATRANGDGLSLLDIVVGLIVLYLTIRWAFTRLPGLVQRFCPPGLIVLGWIFGAVAYGVVFVLIFFGLMPLVLGPLNGILGPLGTPILGLTTEHYIAVWVENAFYRNFLNSMLVTAGVVTVSLTVGTLAGYGLARSGSDLAFWLLILALVFRALPHSVLVAGYLPVFINSSEILRPILGDGAPTLYGQPWAVIAVLVAINQPFTI